MAVSTKQIDSFVNELAHLRQNLEQELGTSNEESLIEKKFVQELQAKRAKVARDIRNGKYGEFDFGDVAVPPERRLQVVTMLKVLVYPEIMVSEMVASRIPQLPDLDLKARASQQVIDELKHARVLRETLKRWGEDPDELYLAPPAEIEAVFDYVSSLETPEEFFTANFMCEGLFLPSHLQVMYDLDRDAFAEYIDATMADEAKHVALARDVILRYVTDEETKERCRRVAKKVTELFVAGFKAKIQVMTNIAATASSTAVS